MTSSSVCSSLKSVLRGEMRVRLNGTAGTREACVRQGTAIVQQALAQSGMTTAAAAATCRVSLFLSMPTAEIATRPLLEALFALTNQVNVFVPRLHKPTASGATVEPPPSPRQVMSMVQVFSLADLDSFPLDSWGIPAPPATVILPTSSTSSLNAAPPAPRPRLFDQAPHGSLLDVVFVPGVAFDEVGGRLGHGKGFYDRFIEQCEQAAQVQGRKRPYLVGLCLNEQLLPAGERVPMGEHDRFVDYVITEQRTIFANKDQQQQQR